MSCRSFGGALKYPMGNDMIMKIRHQRGYAEIMRSNYSKSRNLEVRSTLRRGIDYVYSWVVT
jgi:hypothetical protein